MQKKLNKQPLFARFIFLLLLASCGTSNNYIENKLISFELEYDKEKSLNFGDSVDVRIIADLVKREKDDITGSPYLSVISNDIDFVNDSIWVITKRPSNFAHNKVLVNLSYQEKSTSFKKQLAIKLNFNSEIKANIQSPYGKDGDAGGPITKKIAKYKEDGSRGYNGYNGYNGDPGKSYSGYLWIEHDTVRLLIEDELKRIKYCFQSTNKDQLFINAKGAKGGNGGNGSDGEMEGMALKDSQSLTD